MTEPSPFDCVNLENVCRVCYRSDLSIHLANFDEITAIQTLSLEPYFSSMQPLYFCVYCSAILKKSVLFVKQCIGVNQLFTSTTKDATLPKRMSYNNMSIEHLDTNVNCVPIGCNEEIKEEPLVDDEHNHFGDDCNDDDDDDDDLPLNMLKSEDDIKEEIISEEVSISTPLYNKPKKISKKRKKNQKIAPNDKDLSKDEINTLTVAGIPKHPVEHRPTIAEGVNGTGSVFSKRMVKETEQYLVIKLTKNEVLQEIKENLCSEKYLSSRYKCDKCAKDFNFEDVLRNHMEKHTKKSGYLICDLCGQYFPSTVSLRGHMKSHTTRYKCKLCGVIKKSRQHLLEHYTLSHCGDSVKYTCDLCTFVTNKRTVIQRHTRTHAPTKRHICDLCGRSCKTLEALRVHRIRHDTTKQFQCPTCPRRFVYPTLLKRHVREAHELAHNYCVECDRTFTAKETLQNHFKKSKRHRDTPAYGCTSCSAKFDTRSQLASHRTRVHGEPVLSFQCESCPKKYQCKDTLRAHIRRVHNKLAIQRRHTCNQCNKEFMQKHSLTRHLRTHTAAPCRRNSTQAQKPDVDTKSKS